MVFNMLNSDHFFYFRSIKKTMILMNNFSNIFSINLLSRIAIKNFASSMVQSYYATTCINRILTNAAIETIENLMIKEKI